MTSLRQTIENAELKMRKDMDSKYLSFVTGRNLGFTLLDKEVEYANDFEMIGKDGFRIVPAHTPDSEPWILATLCVKLNHDDLLAEKHKRVLWSVAWRDDIVIDYDELAGNNFHDTLLLKYQPISYRSWQLERIRKDFLDWFDRDRGGGSHSS